MLTVWSRSRFGDWVVERSYPEQHVRGALGVPEGGGVIGRDGRYYIALPQGVHASPLIEHPGAAASLVRPLSRRVAS
jgi:hypothetical protein